MGGGGARRGTLHIVQAAPSPTAALLRLTDPSHKPLLLHASCLARGARTPAMGALKPAATPAPAPAASREVRCRCLLRRLPPRALAVDLPMSTEGPSGPREAPAAGAERGG